MAAAMAAVMAAEKKAMVLRMLEEAVGKASSMEEAEATGMVASTMKARCTGMGATPMVMATAVQATAAHTKATKAAKVRRLLHLWCEAARWMRHTAKASRQQHLRSDRHAPRGLEPRRELEWSGAAVVAAEEGDGAAAVESGGHTPWVVIRVLMASGHRLCRSTPLLVL